MVPRAVKNCMQLFLKLVNLIIGMAGIAMILYSFRMIKVWQQDAEEGSSFDDHSGPTFPWFIHAFVGVGTTLCALTCLGHFAANTANAHCLSFYMAIVFLLLMLETALMADIFLNCEWEKDLPEDPSGRFDDFKDFVKSSNNICLWIGLLIILAQGCSILLAAVLRTLPTDQSYDSEDDYDQNRLPLLNPSSRAFLHIAGEPYFPLVN